MINNNFIKITNENELEDIIEFAWNITKRDIRVGYPSGVWEYNGLRKSIINAFNDSDDILVLKEDNKIIAFISLLIEEDNKYLQTIGGIYCIDDFDYTFNKLLEYKKENYPDFKLYIIYSSYNKEILNRLAKEGEILDKLNYYRLDNDKLKLREVDKSISYIKDSEFKEFSVLHDKLNPDIYWNSDNLLKDIENWNILVYREDGNIVAYALYKFRVGNELGEIFALSYKENVSNNIKKDLIYLASKDIFERDADYMVYFTDVDGDENEILLELDFDFINDSFTYVIE